jgi:hypothetical protein
MSEQEHPLPWQGAPNTGLPPGIPPAEAAIEVDHRLRTPPSLLVHVTDLTEPEISRAAGEGARGLRTGVSSRPLPGLPRLLITPPATAQQDHPTSVSARRDGQLPVDPETPGDEAWRRPPRSTATMAKATGVASISTRRAVTPSTTPPALAL